MESNRCLLPGKCSPNILSDGEPWSAANRYAIDTLNEGIGKSLKTVTSFMSHLKAYASWLEDVWTSHSLKSLYNRC